MKRFLLVVTLVVSYAFAVPAQQPAEQRAGLNEAATGFDGKGAPAIEGKLLTQVLNGSEDSPVTNVRLVVKNTSSNFYTYVTGWATFYDSGAVRCGEGLFKVDALAPGESAETDTPGLRLKCTPASWRIAPNNLLTRAADMVLAAPPPAPEPAPVEKRSVSNFVLSISGEDHPIQVGNPVVVKMGGKRVKIVLREAGQSQ